MRRGACGYVADICGVSAALTRRMTTDEGSYHMFMILHVKLAHNSICKFTFELRQTCNSKPRQPPLWRALSSSYASILSR